MKYFSIALLALFLLPLPALANTVTLQLTNHAPLEAGKSSTVTFTLKDADGKPVSMDKLKEVHTKRLHMLIIDSALSDYHHEHPVEINPGEYSFTFTPKNPGDYRIWADITPLATGKQEYVVADLKANTKTTGAPDKKTNDEATAGGLTFALSFENSPKAGEATMGKVLVMQNGKLFSQLEPVMGAYAHIVGFYEDREHIMHIHPMGDEPTSADQRGGPELHFHMQPMKAGFVKLFVQVRVNGADVFAPFGVMVNPK